MSFYNSRSGMPINGSAELANLEGFTTIPDNTHAKAMLQKIANARYQNQTYIEVTYKIAEGDFKNRLVRQKIKCFDADPEICDKGINQLVRLFNLCNYAPETDTPPTDLELANCIGNIIGILIGKWEMDGKEGNYIKGTYENDEKFSSALQRNPKTSSNDINLPW